MRHSGTVEVCILAGGLGSRMGGDKARLLLHGRTLLWHARRPAVALGLSVRVIRRDLVPRSGPLGGVFTALRTSRAEASLFVACDMPFVPVTLVKRLLAALTARRRAVFTSCAGVCGFPFAVRRSGLSVVAELLAGERVALQTLAATLSARFVAPTSDEAAGLVNINTRTDLADARKHRCKPCGVFRFTGRAPVLQSAHDCAV